MLRRHLWPADAAARAVQTARLTGAAASTDAWVIRDFLSVQHYFTVNFSHENQKALELRTEDAKDCDEWVAAITHARYAPAPRPRQKRGNPRA